MKRYLENRTTTRRLLSLALTAILVLPVPALAASVALATAPLATATTSTVKPNVMFILDNSGSMDGDFLPDWADDSIAPTPTNCSGGCPTKYTNIPALHRNNGFNGVAYNPAVTYAPPVLYNADGTLNTTTYPNIGSPWTAVKDDAYGVQRTSSTNLASGFPDVEWCTSTAYITCLRNDNLILPGTVGGANYTYGHSKVSTGSGSVATGNPDVATTATRTFGPFYYTIVAGEFCDSPNLKNCQATQTATFSHPAQVRWCNSAALTNCQGINNSTFKYPRYPTTFYTPAVTTVTFTTNPASVSGVTAVTAVTGVNASGSITFNFSGSLNPTGFSIKVNGTEILTSTAPGSQSATGLATWVSTHSSLAGYTITSPSAGKVTITANTAVATTYNISTIVVADTTTAGSYATVNAPVNGVTAVTAVRPTALITFSGAGNATSATIARSLPGSKTITVGGVTGSTSNPCTIGANKTTVQAAAAVVACVGTGNTVKAYVGSNAITPTCAAANTSQVCLVDNGNYTNGTAVATGTATLGGLTMSTTATAGGVAAVTGVAAVGSLTFTNSSNISPTGFSIKVNGTEILTSSAPGSQSSSGLATWVASHLTGAFTANYTIATSTSTVTFTAKTAVAATYDIGSIVVTSAALPLVTSSAPSYVAGVTAVTGVTGVQAAGTITFTNATSVNPAGFSVKVNGTEIMTATTPGAPTSSSGMATWVKNNSSLANYAITNSGSTVTITASANGPAWNISTIAITQSSPSPAAYFGSFMRTDIVPGTTSYPYPGTATKASSRTDCAGTTCTYAEEMTNFANWWTYYHTRMQAMKSSVSRAFQTIDNRFRVGFSTITEAGVTDGAMFLGNQTFELAHKNNWYTKLFAQATPGYTPLRGALSKAGRYYAKRYTGQVDPVQYSCQQNFTILSTDGYWNTNAETSSYGPFDLTGSNVGNLDGGTTARPMKEGTTAVSNTLADVAKYYYDTDLRTSALSNCAGGTSPDFPSGNPEVCTNNVFISSTDNNVKQHMTTFTMGLGADGTLDYTADYLDATSGDYYNLKNGLGSPTVNWPDPIANSAGERIDDLWHAAVNGRGTYFSAKDPNQIITGLNKALSSITAKLGSAAAAATSTLNPVAGNNFAYVASYTTVKWMGNLESRSINVDTGVVSGTATWCVENITAGTCAAPGTTVADTSGSSTIYNCVVTGATAGTCTAPGVFDAIASVCTTQIANACTGTMPAKVAAASDTRTIYTAPAGGLTPLAGQNLVPFDAAFATANPTNFAAAHINGLNQWGSLSGAQQNAAQGVNLINYLRGQNGFEDRTANIADNRLYRTREAVLGDALESQPAYISAPVFSYPYAGYSSFKTAQASRAGTVFMGTNDGMMHAFAASDGVERWAYVPSMVIPDMWKLATTSYSNNHANFVNGTPVTTDIFDSAASAWKTILVGGLNGGGRGYYALDITVPATPVLLWEFTPANDSDLGYSFGQPVVTRKADGTWVVLVTSGYDNGTKSSNPTINNSPAGSGKGYLYVLNATTGAIISKISTNVGDATTPSGLAKIAGWNNEPAGNAVGYVYGGDLLGNVWRFDINSPVAATVGTGDVLKFATLFSDGTTANTAGTLPQPITTTPVLGKINGKRVIFVGTGKYLETSDLTNTQVQTQYAIQDDDATSTLVNPRTTLVHQTLTNNPDGSATRTSVKTASCVFSGRGWYVDFPDIQASAGSERVNIDSKLLIGTLLVPTIVPSNTVCSPGGYGWLNFFDYQTGCAVDPANNTTNLASLKYDSTIVGVNIIFIKGVPIVEVVTSTNPTPEKPPQPVPFSGQAAGFTGKRVLWRELIP